MSESSSPVVGEPVTMAVSRRVKPGCEAEFEVLVAGVAAAARTFPGHISTEVIRPAGHAQPEYQLISKFDGMENMRRWQESGERLRYYAQIQPLLVAPPEIQCLTGMETWFTLPDRAAVAVPPRYKMAIVSWLAIFPLVVLILFIFGDMLASWNIVCKALFITAIAIPTMTFVLMPQMTKIFAGWLYPTMESKEKADEGSTPGSSCRVAHTSLEEKS